MEDLEDIGLGKEAAEVVSEADGAGMKDGVPEGASEDKDVTETRDEVDLNEVAEEVEAGQVIESPDEENLDVAAAEGDAPDDNHIAGHTSSLTEDSESGEQKTEVGIDLSIEEPIPPGNGIVDTSPLVGENESEIVETETLNLVQEESINGIAEIHLDEQIGEVKELESITDRIHPKLLSEADDFETLEEEKPPQQAEGFLEKGKEIISETAQHELPIVADDETLQSSKAADDSTMIPSENVVCKSLKEPHQVDDAASIASSDANAHVALADWHSVSPLSWLSCCGIFSAFSKK